MQFRSVRVINKFIIIIIIIIIVIIISNVINTLSAIWLWNMLSYINAGTQAKVIWKQDPEANIWPQEGWE